MFKRVIKNAIIFLIPKRKMFIFESSPDFSDNTYCLFKYIAENHLFTDYKFVWTISDKTEKRTELCGVPITCIYYDSKTFMQKLKKMWYLYSARFLIDANRFLYKNGKYQTRVYLGHGMPVKIAEEYCVDIKNCDLLATLGEGFTEFYEKYINKDGINPVGFPRNEILTNSVPDNEKFILWMPTYRQHRQGVMTVQNIFPLGIPVIKSNDDLTMLNDYLNKKNVRLLLRPHPAQDLSFFNISNMENIIIANDDYLTQNNITLYELISKSSALITDYSSVYYDYLLTNRPIGLTLEDHIPFGQRFGLFFNDIRNELPGYLIDTVSDMMSFVDEVSQNKDSFYDKRNEFRKKMGIEPKQSCKLITDYLKEKI